MSEWRESCLGELCDITSSKRIFYNEYVSAGVPFYRSKEIIEKANRNNISTELFITNEKYDEIKMKFGVPKKGDILMTSVGTLGVPYVIKDDEKFYFKDGNLTWLKPRKNIYSMFLYYYLISNIGKQKLDEITIGSTQEALTISGIKTIDISIPSFPEQKAIAEILSSFDDKIDLLNRQNKTLETIAETYFRQWFIEEADEDWEVSRLGDVINIFDSKRVPLSNLERDKMKSGFLYPYYGAATIIDNVNNYLFDGEYILIGEDGTVETPDGFPILQYATGRFWVNNHTHVITSKAIFNNYFLWYFLKQCNISNIVTGAVQPKINQENLKSIEIVIPDSDLIENANALFETIFKKLIKNTFQIQTLQRLRDTLLPKLISGEVKVKM